MNDEPRFTELRDVMRSAATQIETASSIDELRLALVPAFRLLGDRYEGRAYDTGEIKRP